MKARNRVEPSTIAASSSSFGTLPTKPRSVQIVNGRTNARYVSVSPTIVLISFHPSRMRNSEMISASAGTICTSRIITMNARRPAELEPRDGDRCEEGDEQREHQHEHRDAQAVLHRGPEEVALEHLAVVGERARVGQELWRRLLDVDAAAERRQHHPVDGERGDQEDEQPQQVGHHVAAPAARVAGMIGGSIVTVTAPPAATSIAGRTSSSGR